MKIPKKHFEMQDIILNVERQMHKAIFNDDNQSLAELRYIVASIQHNLAMWLMKMERTEMLAEEDQEFEEELENEI